MENNLKQRKQKQLGGITGAGFLPGQSGNPKGRPHTKGLLNALRSKVAEVDTKGRTIESLLFEVLVNEALDGKNRLAAVEIILDRLEGRSRQRLEVADVTAQLRDKSDQELQFHLDNNRWPDEQEMILLDVSRSAGIAFGFWAELASTGIEHGAILSSRRECFCGLHKNCPSDLLSRP
jgi:hypothetical protein